MIKPVSELDEVESAVINAYEADQAGARLPKNALLAIKEEIQNRITKLEELSKKLVPANNVSATVDDTDAAMESVDSFMCNFYHKMCIKQKWLKWTSTPLVSFFLLYQGWELS